MTGLIYLDIAIGLVFLLLVFSLFASAIQEAVTAIFNLRAKSLREGIRRMIGNDPEFQAFWNSPLINSLKGPQNLIEKLAPSTTTATLSGDRISRAPSSVPTDIFTKTVLSEIHKALQTSPNDVQNFVTEVHEKARADDAPELVKRISIVLQGVENDAKEIEAAIGKWYDDTRDRFAGWYIRRMQAWLFVTGLLLAMLTNTDPIRYAVELRENDALRQKVVQIASEISTMEELEDVVEALLPAPAEGDSEQSDLEKIRDDILAKSKAMSAKLNEIEANIGWKHCDTPEFESKGRLRCFWETVWPWAESDLEMRNPILGWLLLGLGVMLGAQFWLDMLRRFVSIRSAGTNLMGGGTVRKKTSQTTTTTTT